MLSKDKLEKEIRGIVHEITQISYDKLIGNANFIDDLGIESIMAVDIIAQIEETYNIEIPEERYGEVDCLDSVVELVITLVKELSVA